jgi:hypothetical protein
MGHQASSASRDTQKNPLVVVQKEEKAVTTRPRLKVKIGIMCFDFVPCKHFVQIEGIPGWAVYDARQIAQRFVRNPEAFEIDSKYMPELNVQRPDANHFEPYVHDKLSPIDPDVVIEMHKKKQLYTTELK